ncbi:sensor histidine kinase [Streptomyces sp. NPDC057027]|uniref:sensor histidine kinase n=1 Tax=Streptomyces sp. NPDC057027 TaxID=3346004 RepID=UPI00363D493E
MTPEETPQPLPATTGPSRHAQRILARVRAFDTRHPWVWDAAVTLTWTVAALVDAAGGWRTTARDPSVPVWLVVTLCLALSVPLYWRRRHPTAVLAVMACATLVGDASGAFLQAAYLQMLPVFHIALSRPPRALLWALALILPPLVTGAVRFPSGAVDQRVVPALWAYALAALLGIAVRSRRDERAHEVRLAATAERARIAREMHDIIGHNLAVITGLADGGRYAAAKNPERATQALEAIGTTSRQALAELRRLLSVLHDESDEGHEGGRSDEPAARTPQPALTDLERLITGVRKAGLPVRAELSPPGPAPLSAGAQLTVYRVLQEALTNTLKHAGPGATASVRLSYGPGALEMVVTDTGTRSAAPGRGHGITGMRERAARYDGTLETGPLPTGGWRVALRIPLEDPPP